MTTQNTQAYIADISSTNELMSVCSQVEKLGIAPQNTTIGGEFAHWTAQLHSNTVAWIYSIEMFDSITELITQFESLKTKNIELKSIAEPWFNNPTTNGDNALNEIFKLITKLESRRADKFRPVERAHSLATDDKVRYAIRLVNSGRMAITKACKVSGCTVNSYYRHLKKMQ